MDKPRVSVEEMKAWSSTRARDWISTVQEDPAPGNAYWWRNVRWMAQGRAYDRALPADERRDWAKTMLAASECEQRFGEQRPWHAALDRFMMRAYIIVNLGPVSGEEIWEPAALARDVLKMLTMSPEQARERAERWRTLPVEQVRLLRDHKNMLGALLPGLVDLLPEGDLSARVRGWLAIELP